MGKTVPYVPMLYYKAQCIHDKKMLQTVSELQKTLVQRKQIEQKILQFEFTLLQGRLTLQ